MLEVASAPIPPASERATALGVAGKLPHDFDTWFRHWVARDPAERFQRVDAAVHALLSLLQTPLPPTRVAKTTPSSAEVTWVSRASEGGTVALPRSALSVVAALVERRDWNAARVELERAAARGADDAQIWALRGDSDLRLGRFDEGLVDFCEAIVRGPSVPAYLCGRAEVHDVMGDARAARADRADADVLGPVAR